MRGREQKCGCWGCEVSRGLRGVVVLVVLVGGRRVWVVLRVWQQLPLLL